MVTNLRLPFAMAALACALGVSSAAMAGPYSALYGFGDSLSDSGNDFIITGGAVPSAAYYTDGATVGRFTNGRNYLDGLAQRLGVGLAPSVAGGTNYAFGGARTNYSAAGLPPFTTFNNQVAAFGASHASADSDALYVLWIGANDMADAIGQAAFLGNPSPIVSAITVAMNGIGAAIADLSGLGAQHFLVPNLPDLSLVPAIAGLGSPGLNGLAQFATTAFNANLASLLAGISGPDVYELDIYGALNDIVANPAAYGFTDTTSACYSGDVDGSARGGPTPPTVCANPNEHVFFDYEHPSAAVHAVLAQRAFDVVPEPPATWALALAAAAIVTLRKRRALKRG